MAQLHNIGIIYFNEHHPLLSPQKTTSSGDCFSHLSLFTAFLKVNSPGSSSVSWRSSDPRSPFITREDIVFHYHTYCHPFLLRNAFSNTSLFKEFLFFLVCHASSWWISHHFSDLILSTPHRCLDKHVNFSVVNPQTHSSFFICLA